MLGQIYEMICNQYHYVGKHDGDIFLDNYWGSGIAWQNVVRKYGVDKVKRNVIDTYQSKEEGDKKEKIHIQNCRLRVGKNCLNIADGGQGGDLGLAVREKISISVSGEKNGMFGKKLSSETLSKISTKLKGHPNYNHGGYKHTEEAKERIRNSHCGKHVSESTKEKLRYARLHQKNLNLKGISGLAWFFNSKENKEKVFKIGKQPDGWVLGRKPMPYKGKIYYTNGVQDLLIDKDAVPPPGFTKGRKTKPKFTKERNKKISEKLKGRIFSEETKEKIRQSVIQFYKLHHTVKA